MMEDVYLGTGRLGPLLTSIALSGCAAHDASDPGANADVRQPYYDTASDADLDGDADRNWCGGPETIQATCSARLDGDGAWVALTNQWVICDWTWLQAPNHSPWIFEVEGPGGERTSRRDVASYNLQTELPGYYAIRGAPLVDDGETCVYERVRIRAEAVPKFRVELEVPEHPGMQHVRMLLRDERGRLAPSWDSASWWGEGHAARIPFFAAEEQANGGAGTLLLLAMDIRAQVALVYEPPESIPSGAIEGTVRISYRDAVALERAVRLSPGEGRIVAGIDGRTGIVGPLDLAWDASEAIP